MFFLAGAAYGFEDDRVNSIGSLSLQDGKTAENEEPPYHL